MTLTKKHLLLPILVLSVVTIYYAISLFPMTKIYSFENDLGSHIARLQFFEEHGYSNPSPEWYEGYKPFEIYPPGVFLFLAALNKAVNDSLAIWYYGLITMLLLAGVFFIILGKTLRIYFAKSLMFFLLFFMTPLMIMNVVRLGRYPEVFGWVVFVLFCCLVYYFKEHKVNWMILLLAAVYAFLLLSYIHIFVIASLMLLGLFLIKNITEKIWIIMSGIAAIAATFFWWKVFLVFGRGEIFHYSASLELLKPESIISFNSIIMLGFIIMFAFYIASTASKKREILFYLPALLIALLLVFRLIIFVPVFNNLPTNIFSIFFLFLAILFLMKSDFKKFRPFVSALLLIAVIASAVFSIALIKPHLNYSKTDLDYINAMSKVEGNFLFLSPKDEVYAQKLLAYGSVFYDVHTPSGFYVYDLESKPELKQRLENANEAYKEKSCTRLKEALNRLNVNEFFIESDGCYFAESCEFRMKERFNPRCLFYSR